MPQTIPFISLRDKFKFWAFQSPGIMIWINFLNSFDFFLIYMLFFMKQNIHIF